MNESASRQDAADDEERGWRASLAKSTVVLGVVYAIIRANSHAGRATTYDEIEREPEVKNRRHALDIVYRLASMGRVERKRIDGRGDTVFYLAGYESSATIDEPMKMDPKIAALYQAFGSKIPPTVRRGVVNQTLYGRDPDDPGEDLDFTSDEQ